ncbi:GDSL esterase/lipase At2g04570 [Linum grandiflorum]
MAKRHPVSLLLPLLLLILTVVEAKVPAIIVFGDSSVDAGNNNFIPTVARSNFEPYGRDFSGGKPTGRFSNGRIATDFISEAFGLRPTVPAYLDPAYTISDFAVGVTFASAGTGYDNATSNVLSVIPLWKEIEYYKEYQGKLRAHLGEAQANTVLAEALYVASMGTNDFLENYYTMMPGGRASQYSIGEFQTFLVGIAENFFKELYGLGARKVSIGGIPPMGCMPLERTTNIMGSRDCVERYNVVASEFNSKMKNLTNKLNGELPGARFVFSNPYNAMMAIIRRPSSYGMAVTGTACCATGMFEMGYACERNRMFTCSNADEYVFWDAFHPTQKTNQIIAQYVVDRVLKPFM